MAITACDGCRWRRGVELPLLPPPLLLLPLPLLPLPLLPLLLLPLLLLLLVVVVLAYRPLRRSRAGVECG